MTRKATRRAGLLAILTTLALVLTSATAFAKGKPTTETTNNLSVPAIFIPSASTFSAITACPGGPIDPTGTTAEYDNVTYYIQGQAKWQAQCDTAGAGELSVAAAWGDNLTGAPLKAGTPIRVEMGLDTTLTTPMIGYTVVNLTNVLDRTDTYGTTGDQVSFNTARVWDSGALLKIYDVTNGTTVYDGPATAEINATGAVVYGYNWGSGKGKAATAAAGTYTITFTAPSVLITSTDAGDIAADGHSVTLEVSVAASSGGGRGGGGRS